MTRRKTKDIEIAEVEQLRADNEQLRADNEQLRADNEQLRADNKRLRGALTDMMSSWRYIRETYGDLAETD